MAQITLPNSIDPATPAVASEVQQNFEALRNTINGDLEGGASGNLKVNGVTARELADILAVKGIGRADIQEGVVAAGDGKVTPGSGLVLNFATGDAWIADDSGVLATGALLPVAWSGATVTIAANASGNPRIDQIIATLTGYNAATVSVLQGTASVGATLDNRTGAAALPAGAIRLADILMPNAFAGPFVQNTHIRDRRPWSMGAHLREATDTSATDSAAGWQDTANVGLRRLEIGVPGWVEVRLFARSIAANSGFAHQMRVQVDGSADSALLANGPFVTQGFLSGGDDHIYMMWHMPLTQGSHTFRMRHNHTSGSGFLTIFAPFGFEVVEHPGVTNVGNDGA